jgi:hypothetical protein
MKADFYTKTMLTVIAACLIYLCLDRPGVLPAAQAQKSQPTRVVVVGFEQDASGYLRQLPLPVQVVGR